MDFYYLPASAPCRAVLMVARALGIELNKKLLNTLAGEQLTPEFVKINPQHTIPTLVDNGFSVWESRAILVYLVEQYGKDDALYPKDPQEQALVNQRLYFDMGSLSQSFADYYYAQFLQHKPADPAQFEKVKTSFSYLNVFLEGHQFVAGPKLTVADFSILATVSTFVVADFDISKYANVARWYQAVKKVIPGWDEGLNVMKEWIDAKRKENASN
ncbi:glutathione S-transferase 1-1 isoform X2 [Drosophila virilis]|uniref:Glutathione transferase n=2 Tax=Drosophila virilis TaxID=7244 RepID=B4LXP7_DROVI|nr:glutathione S-transferase 1-1 isoform X2 [Drosophila virilis]EDW67856.1 uncharacterized protein Dvir_GJ22852 [Drosophila virilis]